MGRLVGATPRQHISTADWCHPLPPPTPPRRPPAAGKFARDNCPAYLTPAGFRQLKEGGGLEALSIVNGFFLPTLRARKYNKVGCGWAPGGQWLAGWLAGWLAVDGRLGRLEWEVGQASGHLPVDRPQRMAGWPPNAETANVC